jgi:hypothetical protein
VKRGYSTLRAREPAAGFTVVLARSSGELVLQWIDV